MTGVRRTASLLLVALLAPAAPAAEDAIDGRVLCAGKPISAKVEVQRLGDVGTDRVPGRWRGHDPIDFAPWATTRVAATVAADADGRFRVAGLATGTYRLTAVRGDGARESRVLDVPAAKSVAIALPTGGHALRGRAVHANGTPFLGWIEAAWNDVHDAWMPTGEDGSFRFAGIDAKEVRLAAVRPGEMLTTGPTVALPAAAEFNFRVDVAGGPEVHGVAVAADAGAPLPGAMVHLHMAAPGMYGVVAVRAGEGGRWRAKAWSACRVFGVAPGFRWGEASYAEASEDRRLDVTRELPIRLQRTASVTGRVARADGRPVAGVVVRARARFWPNSPWDEVETTTAADGTYRLVEVDPDGANVFALGGGFASVGLAGDLGNAVDVVHERIGVALTPGAAATRDLVVEASGRAVVRVTDLNGAPVAGALVSAAWQPRSGDNFGFIARPPDLPARSDADGRVVVADLVPGAAYVFQADVEGRPRATAAGKTRAKPGQDFAVEIRVAAR